MAANSVLINPHKFRVHAADVSTRHRYPSRPNNDATENLSSGLFQELRFADTDVNANFQELVRCNGEWVL